MAYKKIRIDRTKSLLEQPTSGHNRWHPDIEPLLSIRPGELAWLETRDAMDGQITRYSTAEDLKKADITRTHPLTGPVFVEGAKPGDLLEVELIEIIPENYGFGVQSPNFGVLKDYSTDTHLTHFDLRDGFATSDQLPNVRIPAAPFMGVLGVAPDHAFLRKTLAYERSLGLRGYSPTNAGSAIPAIEAITRDGLSTVPPRSNGGNLDIKQLTAGSSILLPVFVPGALFSVGDAHYAQGESECVTGLEMGGTLVCRFSLHPGLAASQRIRDPQFRFSSTAAGNRPARFHATTGQSFQYGEEPVHSDLKAAVCSALLNMIDYLGESRGYDFPQAYMICSLACDVRISQMVNTPNFTASAILDLSIFD